MRLKPPMFPTAIRSGWRASPQVSLRFAGRTPLAFCCGEYKESYSYRGMLRCTLYFVGYQHGICVRRPRGHRNMFSIPRLLYHTLEYLHIAVGSRSFLAVVKTSPKRLGRKAKHFFVSINQNFVVVGASVSRLLSLLADVYIFPVHAATE